MGHIALYREWRPKTFDEIVEQHYTVTALKQAVISGQIGHAYLFSGTRGTGKTTMAQVFSRAINCLSPVNGNPCNICDICKGILGGTILDVIEMDAASNNSVDTIRRICDEVIFSPSVARFKVYIVDEVHMLSPGAFNALLKTLEEPPAHAVFILATTEPHRIPATIISRCQRYDFRRIPVDSIVSRLRLIADADNIPADNEALSLIARISDGALRDAISLLDQAKGSLSGKIGKKDILSLVGMVNDDFMHEIVISMISVDPGKLLSHVEHLIIEGRDINRFVIDLITYFRNIMVFKVSSDPSELLTLSDNTMEDLRNISEKLALDHIFSVIKNLSSLTSELKWSVNPRITMEAALIRIMSIWELPSPKEILQTPKSEKQAVKQAVHADPKPKGNWQDILDRIAANGCMTLYLFLKPADAVMSDSALLIRFKREDLVNYNEVSGRENLAAVSAAIQQVTGKELNISVMLESDEPDSPETPVDTVKDSLRRSVEELGIAFYMED